jgi:hypothetical protein
MARKDRVSSAYLGHGPGGTAVRAAAQLEADVTNCILPINCHDSQNILFMIQAIISKRKWEK